MRRILNATVMRRSKTIKYVYGVKLKLGVFNKKPLVQ